MVPTHPQTGTRLHGDDVITRGLVAQTRCVPPDDQAFARCVERLASEIERLGQREPRTLEARLRREYPRARIVARELHGVDARGSVAVRWYAFRDGAAPPAPLDFE